MVMRLSFAPDFDPLLLQWRGPNEVVGSTACSICDAPFHPGDMPLVLWNPGDWSVQLCDDCVDRWVRVR